MAKKDSAVKARQRAREQMAAKLAEQRKREQANEADLATFFETEDALTAAADERDAAIAKAHSDYDKATGKVTATRSSALAAIRGRGETVADLATLTGLTTREVNALLKTTHGSSPAEKKTAEKTVESATATDRSATPEPTTKTEATPEPLGSSDALAS